MDSLCLKITRVGLKIPIYIEISCAGSLNGLTNKIKMNVISGTHNLYLISFFWFALRRTNFRNVLSIFVLGFKETKNK